MTLYQCADSYGSPHFFGAMPAHPLPSDWSEPVPVNIECDSWFLAGLLNHTVTSAEQNVRERML